MIATTLFIIFTVRSSTGMESFIIGGDIAKISRFPHSVFLEIDCQGVFICGGSILNQQIILTAAHCFEDCSRQSRIVLRFGHEYLSSMWSTTVKSFHMHDKYNMERLNNDIALALPRDALQLGRRVKKVVLPRSAPRFDWASVSGWGVINSRQDDASRLMQTSQKLQPANVCHLLGRIPPGTFCAGPIHGPGDPAEGDSGGALIIDRYVQVGIVSYKVEKYSLTVYTNVTYHYDWIKGTSKRLFCRGALLVN